MGLMPQYTKKSRGWQGGVGESRSRESALFQFKGLKYERATHAVIGG